MVQTNTLEGMKGTGYNTPKWKKRLKTSIIEEYEWYSELNAG